MIERFRAAAVLLLAASIAVPVLAQASAADLYKTKCAMCHGADGRGGTEMGTKLRVRSFSLPLVAKESDQEMFDLTKHGKNKMPAYDNKLTDAQIKDLVRYIRSLK
jgi:cytochrome c551